METFIQAHATSLPDSERQTWLASVSGLSATLAALGKWDANAPEVVVVRELLQHYLRVEDTFENRPLEVVLMELRESHRANLDIVYLTTLSYFSDTFKVDLLSEILSQLARRFRADAYKDLLRRLYVLRRPRNVRLSFIAGRILMKVREFSFTILFSFLTVFFVYLSG
jgi:hypothetical protein